MKNELGSNPDANVKSVARCWNRFKMTWLFTKSKNATSKEVAFFICADMKFKFHKYPESLSCFGKKKYKDVIAASDAGKIQIYNNNL